MGEPGLPDLSPFGLEVEARIGRGGSADVYRARQVDVGRRPVAVKVVRADLADDFGLLEREIEAIVRLRHPNTVVVYLAQTRVDPRFLVVELAEPHPPGPLTESRAVACGVKLCSALALAHRAGIVHSDIKPDNILWRGWEPLLGDFGTAVIKTQTRLRHHVGFTREWAPAWILLRPADPVSDVWSLAAVILWLVTGQEPHAVDWPRLPPELADVFAPAMPPDHPEGRSGPGHHHGASWPGPARFGFDDEVARFGPALAFGRRLQRHQHARGWSVSAFPAGDQAEANWSSAAQFGSTHHPGPPATGTVSTWPGTTWLDGASAPIPDALSGPPPVWPRPVGTRPMGTEALTELAPGVAPRARAGPRRPRPAWLALALLGVAGGAAGSLLLLRPGTEATGTGSSAVPATSPDPGSDSGPDPTTGEAATAPTGTALTGTAPTGTLTAAAGSVGDLVFASDNGGSFDLLRRDRDGTVEVVMGTIDEDTSPSLSPDGARIAFERVVAGVRAVFVAPVDGSSSPRRLSPEGAEAGEPVWSPDGGSIAWTTRANGNWDIAVHRLDAGTESLVVTGPSDDRSPSWSPDGTGLVFRSDRTGGGDIYTLDLTNQSLTQVTATADRDDQPAWGEGDLIAFERWLGGDAEVFTARLGADGGDEDRRLTLHAGFDGSPAFAGSVLLIVTRTGDDSVLVADPAGEASVVHRSSGRIQDVWPA